MAAARELAILRVAHRRRSGYEWGQHVKIATEGAALSTDDVDLLGRGNDGFAGVDLAVLEATDELLVDGRLGDSAWTRLHEELTPHQVTDLIFIVGTYAMLAMAFESWQLQPEPGMARLPEAPSKPSSDLCHDERSAGALVDHELATARRTAAPELLDPPISCRSQGATNVQAT